HLVETLIADNKVLEAEREARDMVNLSERTVGAERLGWTRDLVGIVLDQQGRYPEAEAQIWQALRTLEKVPGRTDTDTRDARGHLAKTLWHQGKNTEAESILRELIALNEKMLGAQAYRLGENIRGRLEFDLTPLTTRTLLANTLRD